MNTFKELLSMGVVPIVNENDTVSVSVSDFLHGTDGGEMRMRLIGN